MLLLILVTTVASYAIALLFVNYRIQKLASDNLRYVAEYVAAAINTNGDDSVVTFGNVEGSIRLTLIKADGTVTYDTTEDASALDNHSTRPEVVAARDNGTGSDIRKSDTVGMDMLYYAIRLDNGDILRTSESVTSVSRTALELLPPMLFILLCLVIVAIIISRYASRRIVEPINELRLDEPLSNDTYEELQPLLERIDTQNREKDAVANMRKEFSANVSHELKTPLTTISGYAEIMKDGIVKPKDVPQFSERIYKESQRLIALIEDIIQLSKLDEGAVSEKKSVCDLFDIAKGTCEVLDQTAKNNHVKLTMSGEKTKVYGVPGLIREMVYNITENAIKYNKPGGEVSVWVGETLSGRKVIVSDTGIGIPADQIDRIFERFYRVDKSHSRETGGTGLGLSIVKHAAEINHARVDVHSVLGEGTTMEIVFADETDPDIQVREGEEKEDGTKQ
jgi:two-component system phosphate regulon sensor histidine kinase PhoR